MGPEDIGARAELEAALTRVRAQSKPEPRGSISPDIAIEEAKLKVTRLVKALEALGNSPGQGPRGSTATPFGGQIQECREVISRAEHRVAKLEADVVAEKTMLGEGRARLSRMGQQSQGPLLVHPPSRVAAHGRVVISKTSVGGGRVDSGFSPHIEHVARSDKETS